MLLQFNRVFNLLALVVIAVMITMVSCDDSSTDPTEATLIGSWNLTNVTTYFGTSVAEADSSIDVTAYAGSIVITFNSDGTGTAMMTEDDGDSYTEEWTYLVTEDGVTMTSTIDDPETISYELSGNTLTLTVYEYGSFEGILLETWTVMTFTKQ